MYTDNYYTLPTPFTDLKLGEFEACGTVRKDQKEESIEFQFTK